MEFFIWFFGSLSGVFLGGYLTSPQLRRWLKGLQKNYHLQTYGKTGISEGKLRREVGDVVSWSVPTIEFKTGLFRGRSRICHVGSTSRTPCWRITRSEVQNLTKLNRVYLEDTQGLRAEDATQVVFRYPTLQLLLDDLARTKDDLSKSQSLCEEFRKNKVQLTERIAELEKQERSLRAGLEALWRVSCGFRRARSAERAIQQFRTLAHMRVYPKPSEADVETWVRALRSSRKLDSIVVGAPMS